MSLGKLAQLAMEIHSLKKRIDELVEQVTQKEDVIRDLRGQLMGDEDSLSTFEQSLQMQAAMQAKIERLEATIDRLRGVRSKGKLMASLKWEYRIESHQSPWNPEQLLNDAGDQGWELCSVIRAEMIGGTKFSLIFKRPKETLLIDDRLTEVL